jgi:hypothetical protein
MNKLAFSIKGIDQVYFVAEKLIIIRRDNFKDDKKLIIFIIKIK